MMDASSLVQELHEAAVKAASEESSALEEKVADIVGRIDKRLEDAPAEEPDTSEKTASPDESLDTRADDLLMAGILVYAEAEAVRRSQGSSGSNHE